MATKRHFKLNTAKDVSIFYDGATKTRIVKNEAVSLDKKKVKASKRIALALQQGHILEIDEAEATDMQKAFKDAHSAKPEETKKAKAEIAKTKKKMEDPNDLEEDEEEEEDSDENEEDEDSEQEDSDDEDEEEDEDEFDSMTKKQLQDAVNSLDPQITAEEALTLKNARVPQLKDFLRKRKEEDED